MTTHATRPRVLIPRVLILCFLSLLTGCADPPEVVRRGTSVQSESLASTDNLGLAMQFLNLSDELDPERARAQCAYHLNRWLETREPSPDWIADPSFSRLPASVRANHSTESLARLRFTLEDVRFLQQAQWMRDVARWVSRQPAPPALERWLAGEPEGLSPENAERLVAAERLMDWTVRNIQLDPLLDYPAGPNDRGPLPTGSSPAAAGEPGPGYTYFPWQVMLYGRGDAWQRARVFMQLCRQLRMDAVMLALDDPELRPSPRPWLPAVILGEAVYLFDTELGLPLPGSGGQGIATLQQLRDDPSLLESLDVGTKYKYRVRRPQLDRLVALIDAPPASLSARMDLVERQLTGDDKLALTVQPAEIARQLANHKAVNSAQLWQVPFEVDLFRAALPERIRESPEMAREYFRKELMYEGSHPLVAGRRQAFRGKFETRGDDVGAKTLYLQARLPDQVIDNLATDREARLRVGMGAQLPENPAIRQTLLTNTEILLREGKLAASLWLGISQFETERYQDAIEWLDKRTLQADPTGRWHGAARYNLGRTYEALGMYDRARDIYYADQSPQAHGNRLRARYFPPGGRAG